MQPLTSLLTTMVLGLILVACGGGQVSDSIAKQDSTIDASTNCIMISLKTDESESTLDYVPAFYVNQVGSYFLEQQEEENQISISKERSCSVSLEGQLDNLPKHCKVLFVGQEGNSPILGCTEEGKTDYRATLI